MDETIIRIELDRLRESPTNPRRHFDAASLGELSLSIASHGVIEPIIVRPAPDRPGDQRNLQVTHEIVVGHRRYRASLLAKQLDVPCVVRDLDDEQVRVMQIHENLHREDVNPIEEADGLAELASVHKVKVDDLVKRTGKSRSYVYGRIRLAGAAPEVREACLTGGLGGEIGTRIARLASHKLQVKALKELRKTVYDHEAKDLVPAGWASDRDSKQLLSRYVVLLVDVPFDLADAKLAERAGACTTCPKRAGNDPDLASELDPDTCTDPVCFDVKKEAARQRIIIAAKKAGRPVLENDEAKAVLPHHWSRPEGYKSLDGIAFSELESTDGTLETHRQVTWREALERAGKKAPKPTLLVSPHEEDTLLDLISTEQAEKLLTTLGVPTPSTAAQAQGSGDEEEEEADGPDERPPEIKAFDQWQLWARVRREIMRRVATSERTIDELRLLVAVFIEFFDDIPADTAEILGWSSELDPLDYGETMAFIATKAEAMNGAELGRLLVLLSLEQAPVGYGHQAEAKLALAQRYGVDVLAMAAQGKKEDEEQTDDAGGAGGSDAQGELLEGVAT